MPEIILTRTTNGMFFITVNREGVLLPTNQLQAGSNHYLCSADIHFIKPMVEDNVLD